MPNYSRKVSIVAPCSPENMISEVQRWPSQLTLEDLKECLDYCSTSWVGLYCRLGGVHLLLEVTPLYSAPPPDHVMSGTFCIAVHWWSCLAY